MKISTPRICRGEPRISKTFGEDDRRVVACGDILTGTRGSLRVRVLLFRSARDMRSFWVAASRRWRKRIYGVAEADVLSDARAFCATLAVDCIKFSQQGKETKRREVDPRYAAVLGFVCGDCKASLVSHECVHAGVAVAARRGLPRYHRYSYDPSEYDEEALAYATGVVYSGVVSFLYAAQDRGIDFSQPGGKPAKISTSMPGTSAARARRTGPRKPNAKLRP